MLNPKVDYKGKTVEVFNVGIKEIDNRRFKIIGQFNDFKMGLIFELNISNPKVKKTQPLCVSETQCKII